MSASRKKAFIDKNYCARCGRRFTANRPLYKNGLDRKCYIISKGLRGDFR